MDSLPLVSIIMPVYNAEKYLEWATKSILNQSYENIQLILVNDGSTDKSAMICDGLAAKDSRVEVIHQRNQGIAGARNAGLLAATGDYITFCDNDDEYLSDFLKDNINLLLQTGADVVKFGKNIITLEDNRIIKEEQDCLEGGSYNIQQIKDNFTRFDALRYFGFIWDAIYSRELLVNSAKEGDGILLFSRSFKTGYEDVDFNYNFMKNINLLVINEKIYYNHYIRSGYSTTLRFSNNRIEAICQVIKKKYEILTSWNTDLEKLSQDGWLLIDLAEKGISVVSLISSKASGMTVEEKKSELKNLKALKLFNIKFDNNARKQARTHSNSRYWTWKAIYQEKYLRVISVGYIKKRLLDKINKKSGMQIK